MIRQLLSLTDARGQRQLRAMVALLVVDAILQGVIFVMLVPFLTAVIEGDHEHAIAWLWTIVAVSACYAAVFSASNRLGQLLATEVLESLLDHLGDRLVELPTGWFGTDRSGSIADIATRGTVFAASAPYAILRPILTAFITPATVLVGTLFIDWRIAATMAACVPAIWFVYRWLSRRVADADREHVAAVGAASARVIEYGRVQPALRAAGDNSIAQGLVDDALRHQHQANRRVHLTGGAGIGIFGAVIQVAMAAVITVGTWLALGDQITIATLLPLLVLAVRFTEPITHSGALGGGIAMASNTLTQIQALLDEPTLSEPDIPGQPQDWSIRFEDVTFGYGGPPVLQHLSFTAQAGCMTAIVGPSGSGKTTVTRLIARFYDPESGTVMVGGVPVPELGTDVITRAVAPVFQDVYLFDGTIAENIGVGDPQATREEIIDAGVRARVDEIADRLPGGWDARVGEGGTNLSGGERQRVSIARALLKDAPIVLLDEATAALDIGNEQAISDAITRVRDGRTVVVVAHRLQTIAAADWIIMLNTSGGIAEQGTHAELLAAAGPYAHYWRDRSSAVGWRLPGAHVASPPA